MAKKEAKDKKSKKSKDKVKAKAKEKKAAKKLDKGLTAKKYFGVKACGKKFAIKAPAVWEKGWKEIALSAHVGEETLFEVEYVCDKCSRLSPTKTYLCKAKKLKS